MFASVLYSDSTGLLAAFTLLIFSPVLAAHGQITPTFRSELYRRMLRSLYWVLP